MVIEQIYKQLIFSVSLLSFKINYERQRDGVHSDGTQ